MRSKNHAAIAAAQTLFLITPFLKILSPNSEVGALAGETVYGGGGMDEVVSEEDSRHRNPLLTRVIVFSNVGVDTYRCRSSLNKCQLESATKAARLGFGHT